VPTLLLVRHAENDLLKLGRLGGRMPGIHLNDDGRIHALQLAGFLAARLKGGPLKAIYSSPMERAQETAEPLAKALALPVVIRPGLTETDCGQWSGKTLKSLGRLKLWKVVQQTPSQFRFPEGESFIETQRRVVAEIDALRAENDDPKAVVVCFFHADPIKLAVAHYLGMALDHFQRLVVGPASISVLHLGGKSVQLMALNYDPVWMPPKA
jgi:probable phosphoglycerate mutase